MLKLQNIVGFRFCPTDEELVGHYLRNKILGSKSELVKAAINEIDIYSRDPWDLPVHSKIKSTDYTWHFYSPRKNKFKQGDQQSRTTPSGKWKLTGKAVEVKDQRGTWCGEDGGKIGYKRVLLFQGRSHFEERDCSGWVMHEFHSTLSPEDKADQPVLGNSGSFNPSFSDYVSTTFVGTSTTFFNNNGSANQDQQLFNMEVPVLENIPGSFNNFHDYCSMSQWCDGHFNQQQSFEGDATTSSNTFYDYGSANQHQQLFNMELPVLENIPGSFNTLSDCYLINQEGQWFDRDFNVPPPVVEDLTCFNAFSHYGSANQDQDVPGSFNTSFSYYDSTNQSQSFSGDFNHQQVPYSTPYEDYSHLPE